MSAGVTGPRKGADAGHLFLAIGADDGTAVGSDGDGFGFGEAGEIIFASLEQHGGAAHEEVRFIEARDVAEGGGDEGELVGGGWSFHSSGPVLDWRGVRL